MPLLFHRLIFLALATAVWAASSVRAAEKPATFELKEGDRVVFVGDAFIEQEQVHGWIELMLTTRFAVRNVTFRNLGWSGDTPEGVSREGLSLLPALKESPGEGWTQLVKQIEGSKPTVVVVGYGMASSFDGGAGREKFRADYGRLLDAVVKINPNVRLLLLGPVGHENLGAPWVNPTSHNEQLAIYSGIVKEIATARRAEYVPLFDLQPLGDNVGASISAAKLTENGVQLNATGYRRIAEVIEQQLFGQPGTWRESTQTEALRQAILTKNEWFFHRSRPANLVYLFGFRKHEQGNTAPEIARFDAFVAAEEKRIALLRSLQAGVVAPAAPRRVGNQIAEHTEQPHPTFEVADGFEVTLWAENPQLNKPIQMNFDPQGRLWVASSEVYPQIEPGQAATDKIIVLEDTTGAGRADKATVFADGLLMPMGVEVGDGGAYVAQGTDLLHVKDTDGDGKADVRRTVLSGFGTEDTHHNLHTLNWGPDGRLYMNQSVYTRSHIETPNGVVRLKAGGIFRFDPRDQQMEIVYRGWINAWGHQFDDYGQSFVTDGAGDRGISWAVPGATYFTLAPFRRALQSVSTGKYPKYCGIEIIHSAQFPDDWQDDVITCDFRAHRVVRFKLSEQGSGYVTKEMPELIRSTDVTFRPIDVKLGPDGALYLADWSNPIIQHHAVDFRDPRRDKEHGRIWRIAAKSRPALPRVDLTSLTDTALLEKLISPNGYDERSARRVLVERGAEAVLPDLNAWAQAQPTDADKARLQALWLYQALNRSEPALLAELLVAKDARVRAAAVRALSVGDTLPALAKLVADEHPRVRLEAVRALGKIPSARAAELALSVLNSPMDPFLDYALWLTMNELAGPWLAAVKSGAWKSEGHEIELAFGLKAIEPALASDVLGQLLAGKALPRDGSGPWIELIGTAGRPAELRQLFDQVVRGEFAEGVNVRAITALVDASRLRSAKPDGDLLVFGPWFEATRESVRIGALQLAGTWKIDRFRPQMLKVAGNVKASPAERTAAFGALRELGGAGVVKDLKQLVASPPSPEIRRKAVLALAGLDLEAALPEVVAVLQATSDEAQAQALWRGLLAIRGAGATLTDALTKVPLSKQAALVGLRIAREGNRNQPLVQALVPLAGLKLSDTPLSPLELQALASEALVKGNAERGERVYRRTELACLVCHAIGGAGGKVGPDLTSIGASAQPDYLLESLLYPNAKEKEGYHAVSVTTKDGQEIGGMIVKESDTELILRNAANQEVSISIKNVAKRTEIGSLMPAGLVDSLLPEERLDLVKFLSMLGKPGDYDAARGGVARLWRLYLVVSKNQHLGVDRIVKGDFSLTDWVPVTSLVSGVLSKETLAAAIVGSANTRGLFAATQFESSKGGPATFTLTGEAKEVWINGKTVKSGAQFTVETQPGINTAVVLLNESLLPEGLKLSSTDVSFLTN